MLQALLQRGADAEFQNKKKYTPLLVATSAGQLGCIEELLRCGANPMARGTNNATALLLAASQPNAHSLRILDAIFGQPPFRGAREQLLKAPFTDGRTPLHVACASGNAEVAVWLLLHNADPHALTKDGVTPMEKVSQTNIAPSPTQSCSCPLKLEKHFIASETLNQPPTHPPTHSLTNSLTHSLTHPPTHPPTLSFDAHMACVDINVTYTSVIFGQASSAN